MAEANLSSFLWSVADLFQGELTEQDKLVYVTKVIAGKMLESKTLMQQAANNTKGQFDSSPDIAAELLGAIMGSLDAHTLMSSQALNSPAAQSALKDILLNHLNLWDALRRRAAG